MAEGSQERQCGHKIIYCDQPEATREAKRLHKKFKAEYRAYECPFCHGWHIGRNRSQEAAIRRSQREAAA